MRFYVYVGKFENSEASRDTVKELNQAGYRALPFDLVMYLSLRVSSHSDYSDAYRAQEELKRRGFDAFILNV